MPRLWRGIGAFSCHHALMSRHIDWRLVTTARRPFLRPGSSRLSGGCRGQNPTRIRRCRSCCCRIPERARATRAFTRTHASSRRSPSGWRTRDKAHGEQMIGPVTLGDLIREGKLLWTYCHDCCRERDVDPATIPLPPEFPVPEVGSRMTRSAYGSRSAETKPKL